MKDSEILDTEEEFSFCLPCWDGGSGSSAIQVEGQDTIIDSVPGWFASIIQFDKKPWGGLASMDQEGWDEEGPTDPGEGGAFTWASGHQATDAGSQYCFFPSGECECEGGPTDQDSFEAWRAEQENFIYSMACPTSQYVTADVANLDESELLTGPQISRKLRWMTGGGGCVDPEIFPDDNDPLGVQDGEAGDDFTIPCCPVTDPDTSQTSQDCSSNVCGDPHVTTFFGEKFDM